MLGAGGTEKGANREEVDGKDKAKDKGEDTKGNKVYNKFIFNQIQKSMLLQQRIVCPHFDLIYHHCTRSQHGISTLLSRKLVCFQRLIFVFDTTKFCFIRESKLSCRIFWTQRGPVFIIKLVPVRNEMIDYENRKSSN